MRWGVYVAQCCVMPCGVVAARRGGIAHGSSDENFHLIGRSEGANGETRVIWADWTELCCVLYRTVASSGFIACAIAWSAAVLAVVCWLASGRAVKQQFAAVYFHT